MKKRLLKGIALMSILTMLFSTAVFAAPSPSASNTDTTPAATNPAPYASGVSATADGIAITLAPVSQSVLNSAVSFGSSLGGGASLLFCVDVSAAQGGTITFSNPGIVAGMKLRAGHMKSDGTWEEYKVTEVGNGYVKIQCPSCSPIAVFSVSASPKTGETYPVVMILAIASLAGAGLCYKKSRLEK